MLCAEEFEFQLTRVIEIQQFQGSDWQNFGEVSANFIVIALSMITEKVVTGTTGSLG
jgi:hypothetical protein